MSTEPDFCDICDNCHWLTVQKGDLELQLQHLREDNAKLLAVVEAGKRMRNTVRIDDESWEFDEQELIDECENFDKTVARAVEL